MIAVVVPTHQGARPLHTELRIERRRHGVVHVAHGGVADVTVQSRLSEDLGPHALRHPKAKRVVGVLDDLVGERVRVAGRPELRGEGPEARVRCSLGQLFTGESSAVRGIRIQEVERLQVSDVALIRSKIDGLLAKLEAVAAE